MILPLQVCRWVTIYLQIGVLGYADDAALIEETVDAMTTRLTKLADKSRADADMEVSLKKTFTQHVHKRTDIITRTAEQINKTTKKYKHVFAFCGRRFKTEAGMQTHRVACVLNYDTTEEAYELEEVLSVFGVKRNRFFEIKWVGHEETSWEREHLLQRDGCGGMIRDFWARSEIRAFRLFRRSLRAFTFEMMRLLMSMKESSVFWIAMRALSSSSMLCIS